MDILEIPKYIKDNIHKELYAEHLAKLCYQCPYTFKKNIKKVLGQPLSKFRVQCKMETAHDLLVSGKYTRVEQIIPFVGYATAGRFSSEFKRFFGYTPLSVLVRPKQKMYKQSSVNTIIMDAAYKYTNCPEKLKKEFENHFGIPIISFLRLSN